jgi:putative chitinase
MSLKRLQEAAGITADGVFEPTTFRVCSEYLGIEDRLSAVHFWAQVAHETGNFKAFEENLNYSESALHRVFSKYFKDVDAKDYARQPEKIANRVYADRMGNGNEESGDGWKYRGRGALQLTGKYNYQQFAVWIEDFNLVQNPEPVATDYAFQTALWYFEVNKIWGLCEQGLDEETVKRVTKKINGGYNGLDHRLELTEKFATHIF